MSDNANTTRNSHRKTLSFLPSSWFVPKLPLQPAGQRSVDSVLPQDSSHTKEPSNPTNIPSPSTSSFISSSKPKIQQQGMKLVRKVKKPAREDSEDGIAKQQRRIGDILEDAYSLTTVIPSLLSSPLATSLPPSHSQTSFTDNTGSLRRSASTGNQLKSFSTSAGVQRTRSVAVFSSGPSPTPPATAESSGRDQSPLVFAPREETSQPQSETSSAFYSESLNPSKSPSLNQEEGAGSSISEVPTPAVSQRLRSVSPGSKSQARAKTARLPREAQDLNVEEVIPSPPLQQLSASSSSLQLAPPLIQRRSPSPHGVSLLEGDLLTTPPKRPMSLRRAQVARPSTQRRLSLDLRTLSPESFKAGPARLKKSRSALTSMRRVAKPDLVDELVDSYFNEDSEQREPVDEKQHALNVRRAKKMMQLFGDKPPKELFQIHSHRNRDISTDTISILTTVSENRRESRATFTSVASSLSITRRVRNSVHSSNSEPSSPVVFSGPEGSGSAEVRNDAQKEGAKESMESEPKSKPEPQADPESAKMGIDGALPTTEESPSHSTHRSARSRPASPRPLGPRPRPSLASLKLSYSPSHSHQHSQPSQAPLTSEPIPPLPASPLSVTSAAPFSDLVPKQPGPPDAAELERQAAASPVPPEDFRARRIRAAKLSRFFGVPPHDLTEAFANPPTSPTFPSAPQWVNAARRPRTPRQDAKESSSTSSLPLHTQSEERPRSPERPSFTVEVAADLPRPFRLGRDKRHAQELDMDAVLDQLRRMR